MSQYFSCPLQCNPIPIYKQVQWQIASLPCPLRFFVICSRTGSKIALAGQATDLLMANLGFVVVKKLRSNFLESVLNADDIRTSSLMLITCWM